MALLKHAPKILKVRVSLPVVLLVMSFLLHVFWFWLVCYLVHWSIDYMVEKLGIEKSKINDLSNLLYKNYGTTMAGLRVWFPFFFYFSFTIFLSQNGFSFLNSEHSDNLWLFCFVVNLGNWIWLWLWWLSQVHVFYFIFSNPITSKCLWVIYLFLLPLCVFWSCDIDYWIFAFTVLFMGGYLMRTWNQTQFWGTSCWACLIGNL